MIGPTPLDNLGRYGVLYDPKPYTLPSEAFSSVLNFRFRELAAERVGGWEKLYGTLSGNPLFCMPWKDGNTEYWLYATNTNIFRVTGTTHEDVSRTVGGNYNAGEYLPWQGFVFAGVPVLNNASLQDEPQSWNGTTDFQDMPNWTSGDYCKVLRPFNRFLVALWISQSGTEYPHNIRWSDVASPGALPSNWNTTSAASRSRERSLADTPGRLVDCLPLGSVNIIYKEDAIYTMRFIGGNLVFATDMSIPSKGMFNLNCARNIPDQHHCVIGRDDVYVHNGVAWRSVIQQRNKRYLFNDIDPAEIGKTFMVRHPTYDEIWICYVENSSGDNYPNKAAIWNYLDDTWSFRELPELAHIGEGQVSRVASDDTWDAGPDTTWDAGADDPWDGPLGARAGQDDLLAATRETLIQAPFNSGTNEPNLGDTLEQADGVTGILVDYEVTSGDWSTNNAVGNFFLEFSTDAWGFDFPINNNTQGVNAATSAGPGNVSTQVTHPRFLLLDSGDTGSGVAFQGTLERTGLPIVGRSRVDGEPLKVDPTALKQINRWYPKIECDSSVTIYLGIQSDLDGPVQWDGPFSFTPGTDRYIDYVLTTTFVAYRIVATSACKVTGLWLDIMKTGKTV